MVREEWWSVRWLARRVAEEVAERDFAVYSLTRRNAWNANEKAAQ